jgi:glycosyltransferase involved in cell wall biosynthesis
MYKKKKISVVVPAYNEEVQILKVIDTMPGFVDFIVITDDKSTDRTVKVIQNCQKANPKIILIKHKANEGVGGAIATGYKWSRDNKIDIAVVMAGDAQMDPLDLKDIINPVINDIADYSKANRLVTEDSYSKIPKIRFFGNSILSFLTKIASGYWNVSDSQTGYAAINLKALKIINWDKMYKRYGQPNDILVKLNVENFRVIDVPMEPVYNVGEKSGINIKKAIFSIGYLLIRLFFWRLKEKYIIRGFHPLVLFYIFGFISAFMSLLIFIRVIFIWMTQGSIPELSFLSWLFSFAISFNAFTFAMWFDYSENKNLSPHMDPKLIRK